MAPTTSRGSLAHQDDPRRLDGHVGARADGDADVGGGQRRRVVHAVTDHGHLAAAALEALTAAALSPGSTCGGHLVDAQATGDRIGDRLRVAGDHRHLQPHGVQRA